MTRTWEVNEGQIREIWSRKVQAHSIPGEFELVIHLFEVALGLIQKARLIYSWVEHSSLSTSQTEFNIFLISQYRPKRNLFYLFLLYSIYVKLPPNVDLT